MNLDKKKTTWNILSTAVIRETVTFSTAVTAEEAFIDYDQGKYIDVEDLNVDEYHDVIKVER